MSYSSRSGGASVDALELKLSGSTALEEDFDRGREVEIIIRGTVTAHTIKDKQTGDDGLVTIKTMAVAVDELVEITALRVPRRMKGQTTIGPAGETVDDRGAAIASGSGVATSAESLREIGRRAAEGVDGIDGVSVSVTTPADARVAAAEIAAEDEARVAARAEAPAPEGVDRETGEVLPPEPDHPDEDQPEVPSEDDAEEEAPDPDRHPQVPEEAWNELNRAQRFAVLDHVGAMESLAEAHASATTPTDVEVAGTMLAKRAIALEEDFGVKLLPPEEIAEAPADEPPPAPVWADSPPLGRSSLMARREYLTSRSGLPAEALVAREEELAEIDGRLGAMTDRRQTA